LEEYDAASIDDIDGVFVGDQTKAELRKSAIAQQ